MDRIARASGVSLTNVEALLAYLTEKYMVCAGPDQVMVEKVDEGAHARVLCLTDIKPRGLIIFPMVLELREPIGKAAIGKANKSTPLLWVTAGASEFNSTSHR